MDLACVVSLGLVAGAGVDLSTRRARVWSAAGRDPPLFRGDSPQAFGSDACLGRVERPAKVVRVVAEPDRLGKWSRARMGRLATTYDDRVREVIGVT